MKRLRMNYRLLALAVALAGLPGCPPVHPDHPPLTPAMGDPVPAVGNPGQFAGLLLPLPQADPLTGEALAKARTPRVQIAAWAREQALATGGSATQFAPGGPTRDPVPAALKAYLAAREMFAAGRLPEAIAQLDDALKADPDSFSALRLMGRTLLASNQLSRGSIYLQHAVQIDPDDVEANFLLGRYWLGKNDWASAIHYFIAADESPERTDASALAPLSAFYLARALQQAGYHLAAAAQYERFLRLAAQPVPAYRFDRELGLLLDMRWTVELEAAENYFLVGQFQDALGHYAQAVVGRADDAYVVSRLLADDVIRREFQLAENQAADLVARTKGSEDAIKLLQWVYRRAGREKEMLGDLQWRAGKPDATSGDVLGLARVQQRLPDTEAAVRTLTAYLTEHPANLDVLAGLVQIVAEEKASAGAHASLAFIHAAKALAAAPDKCDAILAVYAPLLTPAHAGRLYADFSANGNYPPSRFTGIAGEMGHYLYGLTLRQTPHTREAEAEFAAAVKAVPTFWPARKAYLTVLVERERFADAEKLIADAVAAGMGGIRARQITIALRVAEQRYAEAQALAEQARDDFPDEADFRVQLASIYRLRQNDAAALAELQRAVTRFPAVEKIYQPLVSLYLARRPLNNALIDVQKTLRALLENVPGSHYGQLMAAQLDMLTNSPADAEGFLRKVLAEHPQDADALIQLASLKVSTGKPDEAETLLRDAVKSPDAAPALVEALAGLLRDQKRPGDAAALTAKFMSDNPESDAFLILHVGSLLAQQAPNDAEKLLRDGLLRFPESTALAGFAAQYFASRDNPKESVAIIKTFLASNGETAEQLYVLSGFQIAAGDAAGSNATLQRALQIMPNHIGANNDLGFFWADEGKNLDQAQAMIQKALDNQPDNPAYVDSMAWVFYKRGQFDKAIPQFERAIALPDGREPDILAHLGDTLFRAGRRADAIARWHDARDGIPDNAKPPYDKLRTYLDDVLKAVANNQEPAVSPLAPGVATAPAP